MDAGRKATRNWLIESAATPFDEIVKEAKITPLQKRIIYARFVEGKSRVEISLEQNISVECVRDQIAKAYDNISNVLKGLY